MCEEMKSDGVTAQRFDIRWKTVQPDKEGPVNNDYINRSKKVMEIGRQAGIDSHIILSNPPTWAIELAQKKP